MLLIKWCSFKMSCCKKYSSELNVKRRTSFLCVINSVIIISLVPIASTLFHLPNPVCHALTSRTFTRHDFTSLFGMVRILWLIVYSLGKSSLRVSKETAGVVNYELWRIVSWRVKLIIQYRTLFVRQLNVYQN